MAQMNEFFMKGVQKKLIEVQQSTGLSKYKFSKALDIDPSFMSALERPEKWKMIPAWVWFLFQELSNHSIRFNNNGEIIYIRDSYTLEEIHEYCRDKAKGITHVRKKDMEVKETKSGYDVKMPLDLLNELVDILMEDISQKERVYKLMDFKAKIQAYK